MQEICTVCFCSPKARLRRQPGRGVRPFCLCRLVPENTCPGLRWPGCRSDATQMKQTWGNGSFSCFEAPSDAGSRSPFKPSGRPEFLATWLLLLRVCVVLVMCAQLQGQRSALFLCPILQQKPQRGEKKCSFCRCKQIIRSLESHRGFHTLPVARRKNRANSSSCTWNAPCVCFQLPPKNRQFKVYYAINRFCCCEDQNWNPPVDASCD